MTPETPSEEKLISAADTIVQVFEELPKKSKQIMDSNKKEVFGKYGDLFSLSKVGDLEFEALEEFSKFENNHHWMHIFRHPQQVKNSFKQTIEAFKIILDEGEGPIGERLKRAYTHQKGLGPAYLTAILQVVYPEKYGVLNGISYAALKGLELVSYADNTSALINNYSQTNQILLDLSKRTGIDLWNLDWVLYVILTDDKELGSYDAGKGEVRWWIEKSRVRTHTTRGLPNSNIGEFTWSPQRDLGGRDVYKNMRKASVGDVVLHLVMDKGGSRGNTFAGVSIVKKDYETFTIPVGDPWAPAKDEPGYVVELEDYVSIEDVNFDWQYLRANYSSDLEKIHEKYKGLVYRKNLDLTQGAHLTFVQPEFLKTLNKAYRSMSGKDLPYYEAEVVELEKEPIELVEEGNIPKNMILHGPVGTGKTLLAGILAKRIIDNDLADTDEIEELIESDLSDKVDDVYTNNSANNVRMVTFHQSYGYEEFVQGIAPDLDRKEGKIFYKLKEGVFKSFCDSARKKPSENFVLIIDEINRGDVSRIFGELITLLEDDKRCSSNSRGKSKFSLELLYSENEEMFCVPQNLYIIGTMNDSDRSIALIDSALRRRFTFFDVKPNIKIIRKWITQEEPGTDYNFSDLMVNAVEKINNRITERRNEDFQIGHAFFKELASDQSKPEINAIKVFRYSVLPLLKEYFHGDTKTLSDKVLRGCLLKKEGDSYVLDESIFGKHDIGALVSALKKIGEA